MLIDSHCHLNFDQFATDRAEVLERAKANGITTLINPSVDLADSRRVVALAEEIPNLYAAIGIHPNSADSFDEDTLTALRTLADHAKVVSIGEIGLDYYWDKVTPPIQRHAFEQQLKLATELHLPIIIHQRDAAEDTMAVLRAWVANTKNNSDDTPNLPRLVLHSFSGDVAMAEEAIELGFYIGISGPITFKNSRHLPDVVAAVPLNRLMVETDAPFLSPHPFRGKRNEPARVKLVAEKIATLKEMPLNELSQKLTKNTVDFFNLEFGTASHPKRVTGLLSTRQKI
ncbi:TatD family hydrolase [Anaerolineales bacterium HSG24]|nr:TatD family hydrolase [Anaerolineales bacterium HSG24]